MPQCLFCGKETPDLKYCNKICMQKYFIIQKSETRRIAREFRIANATIICEVCNKKIDVPHVKQKVHRGDCSRIAALKRKADKNAAKRALIPTETRTCRCGTKFEAKATSKQVQCRMAECFNWQAREKLKIKPRVVDYNAIAKKIQELNKGPSETRDAKCPGCGIIHKFTFEPAWIGNGTPRKGCPRYPHCINDDVGGVIYRSSFESVYEMGNGATI